MAESYYHYTSNKGKTGIMRDGEIRESENKTGIPGRDDARYGPGVYLTKVPPTAGKESIARNNYDGNQQQVDRMVKSGKANAYVKVDLDPRYVQQHRTPDGRDIHLYPGNLPLDNSMNVKIGRVNKP